MNLQRSAQKSPTFFQKHGRFSKKVGRFFSKTPLFFIAFSEHLTRIFIISNQPTNEKVHIFSLIAFHAFLWQGSCPMGGD